MCVGIASHRLHPSSLQLNPERTGTAPIAAMTVNVRFSKHHLLRLFGTQKSATNTVKSSANIAPIAPQTIPPRISSCVETYPIFWRDNRLLDLKSTEIPNISNSWYNTILKVGRWQNSTSNLNTQRITRVPRCALPPLSQVSLGVHETQLFRATNSQCAELGHPGWINRWRPTKNWQGLDQTGLGKGKPVCAQAPPCRDRNTPDSHVTSKNRIHWQYHMRPGAIRLSVLSSGVNFDTERPAVHRALGSVPMPHNVLRIGARAPAKICPSCSNSTNVNNSVVAKTVVSISSDNDLLVGRDHRNDREYRMIQGSQ
mmetsp:Transcript_29021/g.63909  ORF Transcript_29021/g.63909 Transcript_29021/m.63909 type:complete len:313 (-) Transcript_29021:155-1093(-)